MISLKNGKFLILTPHYNFSIVHCGYRRYCKQGLSHQCVLVAAVRGGPLTKVDIKSAFPPVDTLVTGMDGTACILGITWDHLVEGRERHHITK